MSNRKSTVKIENGKVIFSQEILDYFESLRNEETSEWIDKYFEVLCDPSNITATKFERHHIKPIFSFKDKTHTNRKQTKPLADKFQENIIKLSIYNHTICHYFLWKIYKNFDSKRALEKISRLENIKTLSIDEIQQISNLREMCAKENQTKEELNEKKKKYYNKNKKEILAKNKKYRELNKDKISKKRKEWEINNKEKLNDYKKEYYNKNKETCSKKNKNNYLKNRDMYKIKNKEYVEKHKDEIRKYKKEYNELHKEKILEYMKIYREVNKEKLAQRKKEKREQDKLKICYDLIKKDYCNLTILRDRKNRNKELYKNIIPNEYIINN